ncbi:SipW-dependent-type signal peptide-containing protein [Rhodococcus sp. ARC_M6]|uniref:SipW-dependent-type signal peptide-containing protein n=1 Tax=Rhodococcus sp. ARC_M6 TaxID=2928852 RepID=UPI001FB4B936|nr:SipW-dependent-type signal peptide-containing protein [Rhodococcus sp. ARC_M6]MCJ0901933.1 SipW-dependent-type signal peptide-containing protein [Rhodococcus sp. ARC_M6]
MSNNQQSRDNARFGSGMRGRLGETGWTRARAVLSLGMVLGLGGVGTMAAWSDSATATTGVFSTSSVQMKVNDQRPTAVYAALAKSSMRLGESTAGQVKVQNTGTINFNWVVAKAFTGPADLVDKLTMSVHKTGANSGGACTGAVISGAGGTLAAGAEETVCIQVKLASDAGINARFKIAQLGFNFTAEGVVPTP